MPDTLVLQCVSDFTVHDDGRIAGHKLFAGTKLGDLGFLRDDNPFILPFNGSIHEFPGVCDKSVQRLELCDSAIEPDVENGVLLVVIPQVNDAVGFLFRILPDIEPADVAGKRFSFCGNQRALPCLVELKAMEGALDAVGFHPGSDPMAPYSSVHFIQVEPQLR